MPVTEHVHMPSIQAAVTDSRRRYRGGWFSLVQCPYKQHYNLLTY